MIAVFQHLYSYEKKKRWIISFCKFLFTIVKDNVFFFKNYYWKKKQYVRRWLMFSFPKNSITIIGYIILETGMCVKPIARDFSFRRGDV